MSRIVKSIAVVDDRQTPDKSPAGRLGAELSNMSVIKQRFSSYRENPYADGARTLPDKQGYLEELNRLKAGIAEAKAELRSLNRLVSEAREQGPAEDQEEPETGPPDTSREDISEAARLKAEKILAGARSETALLLDAAQREGAEIRERARNEGYLEGFEQGTAQAMEEYRRTNNPKVAELSNLLERLSAFEEDQLARSERSLLELVFTVARKILGQELKAEPRAVVALLYETLDRNRREEDIRITFSPELLPAEGKAADEIRKMITKIAPHAIVTTDREQNEGGILVETSKGLVDLSVETQLENLREDLLED